MTERLHLDVSTRRIKLLGGVVLVVNDIEFEIDDVELDTGLAFDVLIPRAHAPPGLTDLTWQTDPVQTLGGKREAVQVDGVLRAGQGRFTRNAEITVADVAGRTTLLGLPCLYDTDLLLAERPDDEGRRPALEYVPFGYER